MEIIGDHARILMAQQAMIVRLLAELAGSGVVPASVGAQILRDSLPLADGASEALAAYRDGVNGAAEALVGPPPAEPA